MTPVDPTRRSVLTPSVIRAALGRVADLLDRNGVDARITVYGGASLALAYFRNDRTATADVDAIYTPVEPVEVRSAQVADEMNLPDGWLNDRMRGFVPPGGTDGSIEIMRRGGVTIRVGSASTLLAMKLRASRPNRDFEDIAVLIRACGITSIGECEALVHELYHGEEEIPERGYTLLERAFGEVEVKNADPPFVLAPVV